MGNSTDEIIESMLPFVLSLRDSLADRALKEEAVDTLWLIRSSRKVLALLEGRGANALGTSNGCASVSSAINRIPMTNL